MPNDNYANEPNQSRSEDIIQSILDNTEYDEEARSRIEYLLIELKNAIEGGGGGGGVTSYAPLTEKPKIDNNTLQAGNNSSSDLGLQTKLTFDSVPTENSTNPVTSDGVYTALDSKANSSDVYNKSAVDAALTAKADKSTTYTKSEIDTSLGSKQNTISDLPTIRSGAALGTTAVQPISGKGLSTNDYTTAEKTKLAGIAEGAEVNEIVGIKVNGSTVNPDANKVVNIAGLQTELSASNKLNPACIDYDSTHRAVSDTEKSTWNGKQNALTTTQLAAVNSGIDSTKVAQIETNKNNILTVADQTTKYNLLNQAAYTALRNVTYNNGVVTQVNADTRSNLVMQLSLYNGSTFVTQLAQSTVTTNGIVSIPFTYSQKGNLIRIGHSGAIIDARITYAIPTDFVVGNKYYFVCTVNNCEQVIDDVTTPYSWQNMAIIPKAIYDSGFTSYQPYAMSNAELTTKEQANENNILLNWTTGKNIIKTVNPGTSDPSQASNFTITTNADNTFTISGSSTGIVLIGFEVTLPVGTFTISGCPSGGGTANYQVDLRNNSWSGVSAPDTGNGVQFTNNTAGTYKYVVRIAANYVCNNLLIKPMISTSTNTDYQPYAMSNAELTAITPITKTVFATITTADTYQTISGLTCTCPAGKTIHITASGSWNNGYCKGIEIFVGDTLQDTRIIGKSETETGYLALVAIGLYKNISNNDITVNVAVKQSATGNNTYSVYATVI